MKVRTLLRLGNDALTQKSINLFSHKGPLLLVILDRALRNLPTLLGADYHRVVLHIAYIILIGCEAMLKMQHVLEVALRFLPRTIPDGEAGEDSKPPHQLILGEPTIKQAIRTQPVQPLLHGRFFRQFYRGIHTLQLLFEPLWHFHAHRRTLLLLVNHGNVFGRDEK